MKIAEVVSTFPPYRGGIGNVAFHNSLELRKRGHQVTVFTPRYKSLGNKKLLKFDEPAGIRVRRLAPLLKYGNAAFLPQFFCRLGDFDIIHLHYPFFGGAEVVYSRKVISGAGFPKLLLTYHMDAVGRNFLGGFFKFYTKTITPFIVKAADKIIFPSLDYGRHSRIKNIIKNFPEKISEISNGVDAEKFSPALADEKLLQERGFSPQDKLILFVGGLDTAHYFKGVDYLIRALKYLEDPAVKLLIVGEGSLKKEYMKLAGRLGLAARVIFAGFAKERLLPKYYNLCDLLVLPSIDASEAFGMVLLEAMSSGKPVIASNLAGVRDVVDDEQTGYLTQPKNEEDLAAKIKKLIQNPLLAEQMGKRAREKVLKQYSWQLVGNKLNTLISKL